MKRSLVVAIKCSSYEEEQVFEAIERGIKLLGGPSVFAKSNEKILLKPNVLIGVNPNSHAITHPMIFKCTAMLFRNVASELLYGDSTALLSCSFHMKKSGYSKIADSLGVRMAEFDRGKTVTHPSPLICKQIYLAIGALCADGIISLSKLKTHGLTRITGAVKNQFGCVPGATKGKYHAQMPDIIDFSKLLVDICTYLKPRLYIMDAIVAMEGNGPRSGDPKKLGVLLFSTDPVALDAVACRLINMPPSFVPTSIAGEQAGLGTWQSQAIELIGDEIDSCVDKHFKVVRSPAVSYKGGVITNLIKKLVAAKPCIRHELCTCCGTCINVCPASKKAVTWEKPDSHKPPIINYSNCIRCFCCVEFCPSKAIIVKTALVGRLLPLFSFVSLIITNIQVKKITKRFFK